MPFALILILIAIIFTFLISKDRLRLRRGNKSVGIGSFQKASRKTRTLRRKLFNLVHYDVAERLINSAKHQYPGKSEDWYLEKVIYDLQRGR